MTARNLHKLHEIRTKISKTGGYMVFWISLYGKKKCAKSAYRPSLLRFRSTLTRSKDLGEDLALFRTFSLKQLAFLDSLTSYSCSPKRYYRVSRETRTLRIYGKFSRKTVVSLVQSFAYSEVSIFIYILAEKIFIFLIHYQKYFRYVLRTTRHTLDPRLAVTLTYL